MKTKTEIKYHVGQVAIFGNSTYSIYFGPLKDKANQVKGTLTFNERLCGRAIAQLAAGFTSLVWEESIAGHGDWSDGDSISVGSDKWKFRIVKRLPKELKGTWGIASTRREILVCRGTAGDMAMGAMLGTDYAWRHWQLQTLRAAIDPKPEQLTDAECAEFQEDFDAAARKIIGEVA